MCFSFPGILIHKFALCMFLPRSQFGSRKFWKFCTGIWVTALFLFGTVELAERCAPHYPLGLHVPGLWRWGPVHAGQKLQQRSLQVKESAVWGLCRPAVAEHRLIPSTARSILNFGRLVISRFGPLPVRIRLLVVMLVLGLSVWVLLLLSPLCSAWFGEQQKSMGMLAWSDAVLSCPGVLQTVQRAEFWGAIIALQAYWPCHLRY